MVLPEDYFEAIFANFDDSPRLGIASGSCYLIEGRRKIVEFVSPDHSRGGLKTYRRQCFEEIGGIREVNGWDEMDNALAQMNGWETCCFSDIDAFKWDAILSAIFDGSFKIFILFIVSLEIFLLIDVNFSSFLTAERAVCIKSSSLFIRSLTFS